MGNVKNQIETLLCVCLGLVAMCAVVYRVYIIRHRQMPSELAEIEKIRWIDELGRWAKSGGQLLHHYGINPGTQNLKIFINTAFSLLVNPLPWDHVDNTDLRVSHDVYASVPVSIYAPNYNMSRIGKHMKKVLKETLKQCGYPTIVYFHGGGWTWLSVGVYDGPLRHLAKVTKFKVIAVEYRKAPQDPFPAAYNDSLNVARYILQHADSLNVCRDYVVLAGDGAGGNLAAAVSNEIGNNNANNDSIRLQLLINPALQMMNFATPSYQEQVDTLIPGITSRDKELDSWMRYAQIDPAMKGRMLNNSHVSDKPRMFLQENLNSRRRLPSHLNVTRENTVPNARSDNVLTGFKGRVLDSLVLDVRLNPMLVQDRDLHDVPDAYIITGQHDVLRDEALMYGHRLQEHGINVEMQHYKHGFHGFFLFAGGGWMEIAESRLAMEELVFYLHTEILDLPVPWLY